VAGAASTRGPRPDWHVTELSVPAHGGSSYSEPGIAVGPDGVLVANACTANAGGPSTYWLSRDSGRSWSTGFPVGTSAIGCGDSDAVIGSDGWFYALTLGTGVDVYYSHDAKHWDTSRFPPPHGTDQADRPWLVTLPRHPATVLMLNSEVGGNVIAWRSTDHAKTFTGPIPVTGGANSEAGLMLGSRPLVDPRNDMRLHMFYETLGAAALTQSVRGSGPSQFPLSQLWEASSIDGGKTWTNSEVLDVTTAFDVDSGSIGHLLPATAIDRHGTIYVVLSARLGDSTATHLYLIHSTQDGWTKPVRVDRGAPSNVFPAVAVSAPGHVFVSWYSSAAADFDRADAKWFESFASTTSGLSANPGFTQVQLGDSVPVHAGGVDNAGNVGSELGQNWGLRDFQSVVVDRCGHPHVTWARDYKGARTFTATTSSCRRTGSATPSGPSSSRRTRRRSSSPSAVRHRDRPAMSRAARRAGCGTCRDRCPWLA
jgi:hypothetical protein